MPPPLDLTDRECGRLHVLTCVGRTEEYGGCRVWRCRCACGREQDFAQRLLTDRGPRGRDCCDACRSLPCPICATPVPVASGLPRCCSPECRSERRRRRADAHYRANKATVIARSLARQKRRRAEGDPVYREQDRRKYARIKADPEKLAAARAQAREWYARHAERVQAERAKKKPPKVERACVHCGKLYLTRRANSHHCSLACAKAPRPPRQRACAICQGQFLSSRYRLTCSPKCRLLRRQMMASARAGRGFGSQLEDIAAALAQRQQEAVDRRSPCRHCGALFLAGKRRIKFCSAECRAAHGAESTAERACVICAGAFRGDRRGAKCCSPDCRSEHKRRRALARMAGAESIGSQPRVCVECGKDFAGHANAQYCGGDCIAAAKKRREQARVDRANYRCIVCQSPCTGDLKTNRYTCSPQCRAEALRRKNDRNNRRSRNAASAARGPETDSAQSG
jgi:hypothetical protein